MNPIRLLVADDSIVFRRLLVEELSAAPGLEVVGTAGTGRAALVKAAQLKPDVVLLDVDMPEMDGLTALRELRRTHPRLPVIMFSALTARGSPEALEALSLGATEYFTKPATGSLEDSLRVVREELVPTIRALCPPRPPEPPRPLVQLSPSRPTPPPPQGRIDAVAVAASTGGPQALAEFLGALPADLPVPVLVVQHMPPLFTQLLAERLAAQCALPVAEARAGEPLVPGRVVLAPGDYHLSVERDLTGLRAALSQEPHENSCRPAADVLFRSVAKVFGPHALAVVLTGMGQDGLRGCEAVRAAGGRILAQDEATSVVWGMPGFVARAGLAEKVLPVALIGTEVVRRARVGRAEGR